MVCQTCFPKEGKAKRPSQDWGSPERRAVPAGKISCEPRFSLPLAEICALGPYQPSRASVLVEYWVNTYNTTENVQRGHKSRLLLLIEEGVEGLEGDGIMTSLCSVS